MFCKSLTQLAVVIAFCCNVTSASLADELKTLVPTALETKASPCGDGWKRWIIVGDFESHRERMTALITCGSDVWVGTNWGRLLTRHEAEWILQGHLEGIQITGIAVESANKVWLSTSDGIRRLKRDEDQPWQVTEFRHYYEGHPAFVSGAYIPGEDAVRIWGYVDDIYIPTSEKSYSPFVISTEHGLFCWGG